MKWIQAAILLVLVVVLALVCMFYMKLTALDQRMKAIPRTDGIHQRLEALEKNQFDLQNEMLQALASALDRIDALESGAGEQKPKGPVTPDFLLSDLERQIHLKRDAAMVPDKERQAQERIDAITRELERLQQNGEDIISAILERVRVHRDPDIQIVLIRDIVWRLGPGAAPGLMDLFRDRDFASNLRVLAAVSAIKIAPNRQAVLEEFAGRLKDPEESLVIKTGLVRNVFSQHHYEGAVASLIEGAKAKHYHEEHRIACLQALSSYDHPQVLRALEEIINSGEDAVFVVNLSIDAYHRLMREGCTPFLRRILEEGKLDEINRAKIKDILAKY